MIRQDIIRILKGKTGYTSKEDTNKYIAWLEKQGEQKHTDKVKPKFHLGDWIISNNGALFKIISLNDNLEYYTAIDNENEAANILYHFEDDYHLWTIEDAKDGDVLVNSKGYPFIFSGKYDEIHFGNPIAYCGVTCANKFEEGYGTHWTNKNGVAPATKEQRDLLFQKMEEAGYKWDAENKCLTKK